MAKILLIDDDVQLLRMLTDFLESTQHKVTPAENGRIGLRHLESETFDLIITDIIMPEEDGLAVLLWVNKQEDSPKIIAMSGGSMTLEQSYILEMCRRMRADKVLQKPVLFEDLLSAVNEVLGSRHNGIIL